jgi:hypothetical protein
MQQAARGPFSTDPEEAAGFAKFSEDRAEPSNVVERLD